MVDQYLRAGVRRGELGWLGVDAALPTLREEYWVEGEVRGRRMDVRRHGARTIRAADREAYKFHIFSSGYVGRRNEGSPVSSTGGS